MWARPHPGGLQMLPELVHGGVGDAHVPEHSLQFRGELAAALRLMGGDEEDGQRRHSWDSRVSVFLLIKPLGPKVPFKHSLQNLSIF